MYGMIRQQFKDKNKALLVFLGISLAFSELYLLLFPTIKAQADQLNQIVKLYPKSFFTAFGIDSGTLSFSRIEYFLSTEIFSLLWPILIIVFAIQLANYSFVGEIENGTIELSLSQPISRLKLFISRYIGGLLLLALFAFGSTLVLIPLIKLHGYAYEVKPFLLIATVGFLFALGVYSIATFFSVFFSQKGWAASATAGIVILMYVLNVVSGLKTSLVKLQYASFFHYMAAPVVLGKGVIIQYTYPAFLAFSVVFTVAAAIWFVNRDIAV